MSRKQRTIKAIFEALVVFALSFLVAYLSYTIIGRPYSGLVSLCIGMIMGMIWVMRNGPGSEYR